MIYTLKISFLVPFTSTAKEKERKDLKAVSS